MLGKIKNLHQGEKIAVLGSGPTLGLYEGFPRTAIAVNGAAHTSFHYDYFVCGDLLSNRCSWFQASKEKKARRLVASFVAPYDCSLYPNLGDRDELKRSLDSHLEAAVERDRLDLLYDFSPAVKPEGNHLYFKYDRKVSFGPPQTLSERKHEILEKGGTETLKNTPFEHVILKTKSPFPQGELNASEQIQPLMERVVTGGTICGVALQVAYLMGAAEIHLFGCSMDNHTGTNYYLPQSGVPGATRSSQIMGLRDIVARIQFLGVPVVIHGASNVREVLG